MDRLKWSWESRECLLILHYELAEKGPNGVSCVKCLSGRSQVRRLALVSRLFLSFEKGIKFPFLQLPWDGNYEFFLGILCEFLAKVINF